MESHLGITWYMVLVCEVDSRKNEAINTNSICSAGAHSHYQSIGCYGKHTVDRSINEFQESELTVLLIKLHRSEIRYFDNQ